MKQILRYILTFLLVLGLLMAFLNERDKVKTERILSEEWQSKAEQFQQLPRYDQRAEDFVAAMNGGEGDLDTLLTGVALAEYEEALANNGESVQDAYIDPSLVNTNILMTNSEIDEQGKYHSKVMYELDMSTVADNPETGVVDKRIVTLIIEMDWEDEKVSRYEITFFNDTLGLEPPKENVDE
ncbi:hypothetical protein EVJ32_10675 [Exiguobacterium sp. SH5S4]|uniref:hypothetical protein n=1 Tax=Exiguobacterium sp. SH5S4 TaxID=2510961 RepID=UPI00103DF098|nr:hypothetical protein [Exiguobacterium sp. SH5S4]TCI25257.1 hypothetical protein EVJ32_10675 [Exiguobacterium sp. SH5S4]